MISNLQIETTWKNKTVLANVYHTPPFKVADITGGPAAETLQLMLMNVSPGILDGDSYLLDIKIGAESLLHLHTQSYQRLFTMKGSAAQSMNVQLEKNASLVYLPHPTVPHKASSFTSVNNIFLSEGSELLWGEIITCGRKGCGEIFAFTKYHNLTKIHHNKKLVVKENLLISPTTVNLYALGQWEGYTHQASLIYWKEKISMQQLVIDLRLMLKKEKGISFGISSLPVNGIIVRILGNKAEQIHDLFRQIHLFISAHQSVAAQEKILSSKIGSYAG
jgi:urease accessory protein